MTQIATNSPINRARLKSQGEKLYKYLLSGKRITCFSPAKFRMKIGYLNSRISDLKKSGVAVFSRMVVRKDQTGKKVHCKEYSLTPFEA